MSLKSWKVVPFVACLAIVTACATEQGTGTEEVTTPPSGNASGTGAAKPATTGAAGAAGMKSSGTSAGAPGTSTSTGGSSGAAGTAAGASAVATIQPFMAMASGTMSSGAAGTSAGTAGRSAAAGSGGQPAKAGSGGSSTAGSSSAAGSGGKAGAGGTGSGAGVAAVSGKATFTKVGTSEVDVTIDVMGCEDGKSYPVHIHEGTSCDSVMAQGGHWGAPAMTAMTTGAAGASGSAAGASGSAGHDASHAAGSGASAAGAGAAGMAAGPVTSFKYRGEGIMDIKCTGTMGTTTAKRNSFDKTVLWTIGTMTESDVVGHVIVVHDGADRIACGKIELK